MVIINQMRSERVLSLLALTVLFGVVHQAVVPISWRFDRDTITIDIDSGADECVGRFTNGQMTGVHSTTGNKACAAKMLSEKTFQIIIMDLTYHDGTSTTGTYLGATDIMPYGEDGSDNNNIQDPNPFGNQFTQTMLNSRNKASLSELMTTLHQEEPVQPDHMIVRIHNQVEVDWRSQDEHYNMKKCRLSGSLKQGSYRDLVIEFDERATMSGCYVHFEEPHRQFSFTVQANLKDGVKSVLVDWKGLYERNDFYLVPPAFDYQQTQLGFRPGGIYNIGIFRPAQLTNASQGLKQEEDWRKTWMKDYAPFISNNLIFNIIIPGTHDALSTEFENTLVDYYFRTQSKENVFLDQLNKGVRSFDLRVYDNRGKFQIMHNRQLVTIDGKVLTLKKSLDQVLQFITTPGNEGEIVILGFHRFLAKEGSFDYEACKQLIENHKITTQGRLILPTKSQLTYGQLIADSPKARVIAAWNNWQTVSSPFWGGVWQKWAGSNVFRTPELFNYFSEQFTAPQTQLVSAQDALNRHDCGPWFYFYSHETYFSDIKRAPNLNIIHSDFIDQSYMVETAIAMNLVKAGVVADTSISVTKWVVVGVAVTAVVVTVVGAVWLYS